MIMTRTTSRELAYRINAIKDGLELEKLNEGNNLLELLLETRKMDESGIEMILKNEGEMIAQEEFIYSIENEFLKAQTLQKIREYKDKPSEDWDFLNKDEKNIIYNTIKLLKKTELEYRLNRADLMVMRKEVIDLVQTRLKSIKSNKKPQDIINAIINNYTYLDTLKNLGVTKEDDIINKYFLDDDLVYRIKK